MPMVNKLNPANIIDLYPQRSPRGPNTKPKTPVTWLMAINEVTAVNEMPIPRLRAGANGYAKRRAVLRNRRPNAATPICQNMREAVLS